VPHTRAGTAIIVGAGIGGLCAAIALRRAGVDAQVFERAPELVEVGAGISLWENAIRALDAIGVGDAVRAVGQRMTGGLRRSDGRPLAAPIPASFLARHPDFCVVVHRAELQTALLAALGREHVTLGARATSVSQDDRTAIVPFADGRRAQGDLVVGADGLRSIVRAQLHGAVEPDYAGYTAWRGVAPMDGQPITPAETWGSGMRFGQVPLTRGRVYWFATANAPEGARPPDSERAELMRRFGSWHDPIAQLVERTPDPAILRNDIYDREPLARWGDRRITLLGDAAHPMTPNLGQGACQAIEDAVVLARSLANGSDVVSALRAYEAARRPRSAAIVRESRRLGWIAQLAHPVAVALRNGIVSRLPAQLQVAPLERIVGFDVGAA
jgi:2-polyprenyl-6-methoxyphenol hydroxylase-like FAD-dependent oxidoreductase